MRGLPFPKTLRVERRPVAADEMDMRGMFPALTRIRRAAKQAGASVLEEEISAIANRIAQGMRVVEVLPEAVGTTGKVLLPVFEIPKGHADFCLALRTGDDEAALRHLRASIVGCLATTTMEPAGASVKVAPAIQSTITTD